MSRGKGSKRNRRIANSRKRNKALERQPEGLSYDHLEPRQLLATFLDASQYVSREISDPFANDSVTLQEMIARARVVGYMPREVVVALHVPFARGQAADHLATIDWNRLTGFNGTTVISNLMTVARGGNNSASLVHLKLGDTGNVVASMHTLDNQPGVLWSSPNFVHRGDDPREFIPNDPSYGSQYHHPLMGNHLAWNTSLGNPAIRVGVTDDGVSLTHPDLSPNVWVNTGEIPGNGIDDDSNGYIDDRNGWDFSSNNNDPNPNSASNDHGTHVAGITAGRTNNGIGIAGVAGQATIMPLQFYAGTGAWTAAVINATYSYAANNGAQIVTTSYNVDSWVGDPVFTAGLQYMYDAGVLHFNSAGNNNQLNPVRQTFEQSLFVASTDSADLKSSFSNYGTGIDISAPGSNIYSTVTNNGYGTKSGTSMSTPNAAGAAALLWGANPTWNRDQVAARLLGTATNIDALNPAYAGWLGTGRVNTAAAMTNSLAAPRVKTLTGLPAAGSTTATWTVNSFTVTFNQLMDPASVNNAANYVLREAGADGLFGTGDDTFTGLTASKTYRVGTNELSFNINGGSLEPGKYQLSLVSGGLRNPFTTALDGNNDGTGGDNYNYQFTLEPVTEKLAASGSLVHQQKWSGNISVAGQQDNYSIPLDVGQTLAFSLQGYGSLVPTIQVRNPAGTLIANVTGSGSFAVTPVLSVTTAGRYRITMGGNGSSTGGYDARILLNSGAELEELGGATNNTRLTAQNIEPAVLALGTRGADRLAVTGKLPSSLGTPLYSENFESGSLGSQWTTESSIAGGRIQLSGAYGTAVGTRAMLMDTTDSANTFTRNQATWTVNLAGLPAATLRFWEAAFADEVHTMPVSFTNTSITDGVAISANNINWYRVWSPTATQTSGVWTERTVDLVAAAAGAGISLNSTFRIRFQQYDNFALPTDGRGYDDVAILVPAPSEDWYSFTLADGESAAVAATRLGTNGSTSIELYNSAGTLLRTGASTGNLSSYISRYLDTTSNGTRDSYFVRVLGNVADYTLVVTRQAEIDAEPNDIANSTAQDIHGLFGALGFATTTPDFYRFTASVGEQMEFKSYLPGSGPDLFVNGLSSSGGAGLLRMELVAPGGGTVASGTDTVNFVATTAGTHYLRVFAQSGSGGEYFVERLANVTVKVESGTAINVGLALKSVTFAQPFVDPVVVLGPPTNSSGIPVLASVANIGPNGFQLRITGWNIDSELDVYEDVSYLVFERGTTTLPNGSRVFAGSALVNDGTWTAQSFGQPFSSTPVVVATMDLGSFAYARAPRLTGITGSQFQVQSQFAEYSLTPSDDERMVHFVAMEPGRHQFGNWVIESGLTPQTVTHLPYAFSFQQPFSGTPSFAANIQTFNESDPASVRLLNLTSSGANLFLEEEQTLDPETSHAAEQVGYIAIRENSSSRPSGGGDGFSESGSGGLAWLHGGSAGNGADSGNRGGFGMSGGNGQNGRGKSGYDSGSGNSNTGKSRRLTGIDGTDGSKGSIYSSNGFRSQVRQPVVSDNAGNSYRLYDEAFSSLDPTEFSLDGV